MHQKVLLFSDYKIASEIMCKMNPKKTKALGRRVKNFDYDFWEQYKERIVEEGSYYKFMNCLGEDDLKAHLLAGLVLAGALVSPTSPSARRCSRYRLLAISRNSHGELCFL